MNGPARRSVAVVLDGPRPPAWQAHALELLASSPRLKVSTVRLVDAPAASLVGRTQRRIERHLFARSHDPLAPTELESPPGTGDDADVTIWLASAAPPSGADLVELRYGPEGERAEPAFRRAIANDDGVVVVEAILRRGDAGAFAVARAVSGVRPFSLASSLNLALWRSATLACRAAEVIPGLAEPVPDTPRARPVGAMSTFLLLAPRWGRRAAPPGAVPAPVARARPRAQAGCGGRLGRGRRPCGVATRAHLCRPVSLRARRAPSPVRGGRCARHGSRCHLARRATFRKRRPGLRCRSCRRIITSRIRSCSRTAGRST